MGARVAEKARTKAVVVVGAQWGDEGKGKVVDYLASSFDYTRTLRWRTQRRPYRYFRRT